MAVSASKLASMRAKLAGESKPNPVKKTRSRSKSKAKKATSKARKAVAKAKANPVKSRKTTKTKASRKPAKAKARKSTARTKKSRPRTRAPLSSSQIMQQNRASGGIPALPTPGRVSARAQQTSLFTEANPMEIIDEGAGGAGLAAARAKVEAARMARKAATKKSSKRKTSASKKRKSARKATAAGRSATAKKVASKRASTKRKTSKRKTSKPAVRKASKRKASKRKSSPRRASGRSPGGKLSKTVVTKTYLSNPQIEAKDIAAFGGGLIGGILVADIVDRFVATRTPEGKSNPLYGTDAMAAIHKKVGDDPIRLLATGGGAAASGVAAYALRDRMPTAAYGFAGIAAGFGMKVLGQLLSDYVVPYLFKSEAADDWSARLFPDYQEAPAAPGAAQGPRFGYTYGPYGQMGAPRPFVASPAVGSQGAVGGCGGGFAARYPYGANQRLAQAMNAVRSRDLSKVFPRVGGKPSCNCGVMPPQGRGCQVCGTAPAPVPPGVVPMPQPATPPIADVMQPVTPPPDVAVPAEPVANGDGDGRRYQLHPQAQDSIARKMTMKEAERRNFVVVDTGRGTGGDVRGPQEESGSGALAVMRMAKRTPQKKGKGRRR